MFLAALKAITGTPPKPRSAKHNEETVSALIQGRNRKVFFDISNNIYHSERTSFEEMSPGGTLRTWGDGKVDTKAMRFDPDYRRRVAVNVEQPYAGPSRMPHSPFSHPSGSLDALQFNTVQAGLVTAEEHCFENESKSGWFADAKIKPGILDSLNATADTNNSLQREFGILDSNEYMKRLQKARPYSPGVETSGVDYYVITKEGQPQRTLMALGKRFLHDQEYATFIRRSFVEYVAETGSTCIRGRAWSFSTYLFDRCNISNVTRLLEEQKGGPPAVIPMTPFEKQKTEIEKQQSEEQLAFHKQQSKKELEIQKQQAESYACLSSAIETLAKSQEGIVGSMQTMAGSSKTMSDSTKTLAESNKMLAESNKTLAESNSMQTMTCAKQSAILEQFIGTPNTSKSKAKKSGTPKKTGTPNKTATKAPKTPTQGTIVRITTGPHAGKQGIDNGKGWITLKGGGGSVRKAAGNHELL